MATINDNFLRIKESYLFSDIAKRVSAYTAAHPDKKVIRMGIGDVTLPLAPSVVEAMRTAAAEMGRQETFHGYGPEQGYPFLRDAVAQYYKGRSGVDLDTDEIFINDGAKSDVGNITDLFGPNNTVLVTDPVYPVYVDTNVMSGRNIVYLPSTRENDFTPLPDPSVRADMIYLCSPNNPTGSVYNRRQLAQWVDYARRNGSILLFDSAYEAYVSDPALPHSIYQIEGARECAIEFCSFSKMAGFTGTRCGYTVVPKGVTALDAAGRPVPLNKLWLRRQCTKFNGVPYVVQRAAEAVFTPQGQREVREMIGYYMGNAALMAETLRGKGIEFAGGVSSPYIWMRCPGGMDSWKFFDLLLEQANVVGTPGAGFGRCGEGYFRLTAFGSRENTREAMDRLNRLL